MSKSQGFKELIVWQKSKQLVLEVYKITAEFPSSELYVLTSQMRRAAISIPSNIAEGYHRIHAKEKHQFSWIAFGSGSELEAQIDIAESLYPKISYSKAKELHKEVMVLLYHYLYNNVKQD